MLSFVKKILPIVISAILIAPSTMTAFAESSNPEVDVLLPCDIPFKMVISRNGKQGIIYSSEFEIINSGDDDVAVEISSAKIQIENEDDYYISDTRELPETGSNIFMELLFLDNQEPLSIVMTDTPSEVAHTYNLKGGEVGKFKFDGTVNEIDGPRWGNTLVQVQICIRVVGAELITTEEDRPDVTEDADKTANYDSAIDEPADTTAVPPDQESANTTAASPDQEPTDTAAAPSGQEHAHDSTDTADQDDTNSANSADNTDTQENQQSPDTPYSS